MKKPFKILLIILALFLVVGCSKKEENKEKKEESKEVKILVDGIEFKFDKDANFQNLSFKVDEKLPESNPYTDPKAAPIRQYLYKQKDTDSSYKIVIRMFYYKNKTLEQAMKDLGLDEDSSSLYTVESEHMSLKMYDKNQETGSQHIYFINDKTDHYAIQIGSRSDIKTFENEFLKTFEIKG